MEKTLITDLDIDKVVVDEQYIYPSDTSLTICTLKLKNGAAAVGVNYGTVDPANQSYEAGRIYSRGIARDKAHQLESYLALDRACNNQRASIHTEDGQLKTFINVSDVREQIAEKAYAASKPSNNAPGITATCTLIMKNSAQVVGVYNGIDDDGPRAYARAESVAFEKAWELENYMLRQRLFEAK